MNRTSLSLNQKHAYRHVALILILYLGTQHCVHMFHSQTPWIRSSFRAHFSSWLSTFFNSNRIIMNCTYTTVSLTLWDMSTICPPFSSQLITTNFSNTKCPSSICPLNCIRWCRLMFLTHIGKKSKCYWQKLNEPHDCITIVINPYTWLMA
jgi:hypothetical protein